MIPDIFVFPSIWNITYKLFHHFQRECISGFWTWQSNVCYPRVNIHCWQTSCTKINKLLMMKSNLWGKKWHFLEILCPSFSSQIRWSSGKTGCKQNIKVCVADKYSNWQNKAERVNEYVYEATYRKCRIWKIILKKRINSYQYSIA